MELVLISLILIVMLLVGGSIQYWRRRSVVQEFQEAFDHFMKGKERLSFSQLKKRYAHLQSAYQSLSPGEQRRAWEQREQARAIVEEHLLSLKKVQELLPVMGEGSVSQRRETYEQFHRYLRQLPQDLQQDYYPHLVYFRDRLERGLGT